MWCEVTFEDPIEQYGFDGLERGRKAFLAMEAVYAKTQRHEKLSTWSVSSSRQKMRLGK